MLAPERLHVWGTRKGGEIDFVCGPREEIEAAGRPALLATREELAFGEWSSLVPAALWLWALG